MNASSTLNQALHVIRKLLRVSYWVFAATLIVTGASFALGLIVLLIFPLVPFLALPFCVMGAGLWDGSRTRAERDSSDRGLPFGPQGFAPSPPH
jgi:hypothetical protein